MKWRQLQNMDIRESPLTLNTLPRDTKSTALIESLDVVSVRILNADATLEKFRIDALEDTFILCLRESDDPNLTNSRTDKSDTFEKPRMLQLEPKDTESRRDELKLSLAPLRNDIDEFKLPHPYTLSFTVELKKIKPFKDALLPKREYVRIDNALPSRTKESVDTRSDALRADVALTDTLEPSDIMLSTDM
jgi:hypothetical protein